MDSKESASRLQGIELLRIIATIMIVTLHVFSFGGIISDNIDGAQPIAWAVYIVAFCGVDIYALISGYVYKGNRTLKERMLRLLKIWLQIVFYTVGVTIIIYVIEPSAIGKEQWLNAIFPICRNEYWYMTAYMGLSIIAPFVYSICQKLEKNAYIIVCLVICGFLSGMSVLNISIFPSFINNTLLLTILFIVGGFCKNNEQKIKTSFLIIVFLFCFLFTLISKIINCNRFVRNDSMTIIVMSLMIFLLLKNLSFKNMKSKKYVMSISRATLGVYLIHTNQLVLKNVFPKINHFLHTDKSYVFIWGKAIFLIVAIFIFCTLIDSIRRMIISRVQASLVKRN